MGFFIRQSKDGFRLLEQTWTPERKEKVVPREGYAALGFSFQMSISEAKARAAQINKQAQLESKKIANTARRIEHAKIVDGAYLPVDMVAGFERKLAEIYSDNEQRRINVVKQWNVVQRMLSELELDPKDFAEEAPKFRNYFTKKLWSPDYVKKLVSVVNKWGHFVSRKRNSHFEPVPRLSSTQVGKLNDAREGAPGIKGEAEPLSWTHLNAAKSSFEHEDLIPHWNWMFIGLWFGLRPKEIDSLKNTKTWKIGLDPVSKTQVLWVYQSKLVTLEKEKRWKQIPIYRPEHKMAFEMIKSANFKRPLNKTLRRLIGDGIETYSPRKGFTDLMLDFGFKFEDVSLFLGHQNIDMTWKRYKNKKRFILPEAM